MRYVKGGFLLSVEYMDVAEGFLLPAVDVDTSYFSDVCHDENAYKARLPSAIGNIQCALRRGGLVFGNTVVSDF